MNQFTKLACAQFCTHLRSETSAKHGCDLQVPEYVRLCLHDGPHVGFGLRQSCILAHTAVEQCMHCTVLWHVLLGQGYPDAHNITLPKSVQSSVSELNIMHASVRVFLCMLLWAGWGVGSMAANHTATPQDKVAFLHQSTWQQPLETCPAQTVANWCKTVAG